MGHARTRQGQRRKDDVDVFKQALKLHGWPRLYDPQRQVWPLREQPLSNLAEKAAKLVVCCHYGKAALAFGGVKAALLLQAVHLGKEGLGALGVLAAKLGWPKAVTRAHQERVVKSHAQALNRVTDGRGAHRELVRHRPDAPRLDQADKNVEVAQRDFRES